MNFPHLRCRRQSTQKKMFEATFLKTKKIQAHLNQRLPSLSFHWLEQPHIQHFYLRWPVCLFILLDYKLNRLDLGRESKSKVGGFYLGDFDSVYIFIRQKAIGYLLYSGTFLAGLGQISSVLCMLICPNCPCVCVCLFKGRIAPLPHELNLYLQSSPKLPINQLYKADNRH